MSFQNISSIDYTYITLMGKSLDNQLILHLLTACSRLVIIKPEQAMRMHPDIGLMIARQQSRSSFTATCAFLTVYNAYYYYKKYFLWMWTSESDRNVHVRDHKLVVLVIDSLINIPQKEQTPL